MHVLILSSESDVYLPALKPYLEIPDSGKQAKAAVLLLKYGGEHGCKLLVEALARNVKLLPEKYPSDPSDMRVPEVRAMGYVACLITELLEMGCPNGKEAAKRYDQQVRAKYDKSPEFKPYLEFLDEMRPRE
ncbi:MAG: hypothetical protein PCFJNLEI_00690 [Verrucomicrobiae bacterium]|nr:hypothetical protein [Verrucomicrobiae bacterium]